MRKFNAVQEFDHFLTEIPMLQESERIARFQDFKN